MSLIAKITTRFGVVDDSKATDDVISPSTSKPEIAFKAILTHCKPWCDHCGGWQAIETVWTDDRVDVACQTCRAVMPEKPAERKVKPEKSTVEGV